MKRHFYLLPIFWLLLVFPCLGQRISDTNESVYIELSSNLPFPDSRFSSDWEASTAGQLSLFVPFHKTRIEGGVRYGRFTGSGINPTDRDFHSFFIYAGIGYPFRVTSYYEISPLLRFGNHYMYFDESAVYTNPNGTQQFTSDQSESEFSYELALRNQLKISDRLALTATLSYNRTITYFPISITYVSVGITHSLAQPHWLKKLIE